MAKDLLRELLDMLTTLRSENGCPWDRQQTFQTLRKHVLEEAQELVTAIDESSTPSLKEELGDVLLQVIFLSQIAEEKDLFTLEEVIDSLRNKIVKRKPHVFEKPEKVTLEQARENWERGKTIDKNQLNGMLSTHLRGVSPMVGASRINEKAAQEGFQWPDRESIYQKIKEELLEVENSLQQEDQRALELEMGDLLLACVSLSHKLNLDPEVCLVRANHKFCERFDKMQANLKDQSKPVDPHEWREAWKIAKESFSEESKNEKNRPCQGDDR